MITQTTYVGIHTVNSGAGPIKRAIPAVVDPELRDKALARLEENKRYSGGRIGRSYLLRGLLYCDKCGTAYVGASKTNAARKRYSLLQLSGTSGSLPGQAQGGAGLSGRAGAVAGRTCLDRRAALFARPRRGS